MRNEIREYLMQHCLPGQMTDFSDQDSLLEAGVIDSMIMLDIISHLESTYEISIDEEDMVPENFDSIEGIVTYVEQKRPREHS